MTSSLKCVVNCGLVLAVLDIIHGISTLAFYGYQLYSHYNCHWNHGIRWCQYYLKETNHSTRVNIGIGEGVLCLLFASVLIVALCKYKPWLAWAWLLKALGVVGVNGYFIIIWVLEMSHHYHQFWDRHNYDQDSIFLYAGIVLTLMELFIMFTFCCVTGLFTYKVGDGEDLEVRKERVPTMETDI
ncbi:hypothetical protein Pcinc_021394 [Petrolisthes cinctipes]|uniref:Uncharacterized protein n=1 Tax=Petrolisthes cinctipes TaxID=88211 RepID=A0AAE1FHH5_PETCI|nr:hypothetical protein Pcinc_021394 [Petrolisthes cinctipes]